MFAALEKSRFSDLVDKAGSSNERAIPDVGWFDDVALIAAKGDFSHAMDIQGLDHTELLGVSSPNSSG